MKILAVVFAVLCVGACSSRIEYTLVDSPGAFSNSININTATAAELEKLPHIGTKTAENIVRFREENGPFRRVEHLMQIRGVSEARFTELRSFIKAE